MAKDAKVLCPLMGSECIEDGAIKDGELVKCRFWVHVQGINPQTGETVSNGDCAFCWTPMLLIENSQQQRQTGAAVESFRNEMVKANESSQQLLLNTTKAARITLNNGVD
jgi:Zn-finger protein